MGSAKENQRQLAGKLPAIPVQKPSIIVGNPNMPRPVDIKPQSGREQERPNTAKRYAEPVAELVERARGGKTAPGGGSKIIPD